MVSVRAAMIARNWGQFMEFMEICEKAQVEVLCLDEVEDAGRIPASAAAVFKLILER